MVPLSLLRQRNFTGGTLSLALVEVGNGGLLLVLTQYLQFVLGYSPIKAGLAFVPLAVAALVGNVAGVKLGAKVSSRYLVLAGMLVMASCFALLTTVSASTSFVVPAIALGLLGIGAGVAMPAAVNALMSTIPADDAGVGSALNDTIQQAGTALGIAILGSLLASGFARHVPASAPAAAKHSIAAAFASAHRDAGLLHAAKAAFTASMSATFTVSAVGVLAAALLATVVMRDTKIKVKGPAEEHEPELAAR
jgi:predicted MFS family arabinose efflux permease